MQTTVASDGVEKSEQKTTMPLQTQLNVMALKAGAASRIPNGAEVILELLRSNGTDCIFASPIA